MADKQLVRSESTARDDTTNEADKELEPNPTNKKIDEGRGSLEKRYLSSEFSTKEVGLTQDEDKFFRKAFMYARVNLRNVKRVMYKIL